MYWILAHLEPLSLRIADVFPLVASLPTGNTSAFRRLVACSKRSDSGERCEVKKAMKKGGDWGESCSKRSDSGERCEVKKASICHYFKKVY